MFGWRPGWYGYHTDSDDLAAWGPEETAEIALHSCPALYCDSCSNEDSKHIRAFLITANVATPGEAE